ncbi:DUF485 domain-containing protein [Stutzerimonas nitrititolerans]|uniref:DUF485 domain-containing protein n=1 Tax=Stutzerimonas nitrititolerans TaxID=2482751 RepID=A0AA41WFY9_9GAMM|nr:DUF485 domain-containing protein [Stutzerimonas nitrititolerans]AFN77370.1 hypothetical protein PSJM300_06480 [Stutzerimonas stutzeri DSM 10701]KRW74048.1 hypothetical protein AO729_01810 [Pseudomonas sp. TTU2014-066ASC]KRW74926.1 hypothetical protein AO735_00445 [Pseudomonas sp. TTU2014-096BSC]MBA1185029.1 DUF485 domain-containing protein [Stutzerimonas stutzeri]OCX19383.1 hypothetical protein BBI09_10160 [Stutzerimonas xanthomarina]RRV24855.1 DUF485 domain-containing protein [Pseudomonas
MNNENLYQQIYDNPRFQELVAKRGRFAWLLSVVMLGAYLAFILLIAFDPHVLGVPLSSATVITWGIPLGLGIIVLAFVLTGIYVRRANGEFDRLNQEILNEVQQ